MEGKEFEENLISVITPVYNAEKHLSKMLDSIFAQTEGVFEIILVDDCSTDNSSGIIQGYCEKYPNIVYRKQEKNMGAAVARNTALEVARGRYVAFLDSDDIWKPEKTAKQMQLINTVNAPFSFTAIEMIDEQDVLVKTKRKVKEQIDYKFLLKNTMIPTSSVVVDRKQLGDFRMPLRRSGQDYATWLQLLRNGAIAYGVDEALVRYRVGGKSLSSNKFKSIKQVFEIQVKQEKIHPIKAFYHTGWFILNALRKYVG